jgi:hypothetical protein
MEYLAGAFLGVLLMFLIRRHFLKSEISKDIMKKIIYRQSHIFDLISPSIPFLGVSEKPFVPTQSSKHNDSMYIPVVFTNNKAYWIKQNALYEANIIDGIIDDSSKKLVDTMAMDTVQLTQISAIVDALTTRSNNDSGSSRNEKL